ncbi:glyoxalase [Limibaculum sp. M0105]|uniref:Glyoxalase n=1 Tax=Thermohalobaculum xanthum TaxID=2753746 RepID=A0A8J7M8R3_9RHOB|nr:VOC family protein [Thermohalobaculum xanthum]MBK0400699.1 glyoxalase [Thermohalobaculum xanthum]
MTADDPLPPEGEGRPDPDAFGRALGPGLGVNLLVSDVARSARWQARVLGAEVVYRDADFAIVAAHGSVWMLHHDRTYGRHPMGGIARSGGDARGAGAELRLYGRDPDKAAAQAEALAAEVGGGVLAGAEDKPHGLRECYLADPEGYVWVPSVPKHG